MPRIRMLKASAGPLGNRAIGQVVEVSDDEALALMGDRAAVLLDEPRRETAMLATPEAAVPPAAPPKRRR